MNDQQISAIGEQMLILASIALGRKVYIEEDILAVNLELRAQYEKLPDSGMGLVDRIMMGRL